MNLKIITLVLFFITSSSAVLYDQLSKPNLIPYVETHKKTLEPLPKINITPLFKSRIINIHDMNEKIVLLNFWASWCSICVVEMNDMFKLINDMGGEVALVTLSIDDTQEAALKAYNAFKERYPNNINNKHIYWGWDKDKKISLNTFNIQKTPETIIIDNDKNMTEKIVGVYDWSSNAIREKIHSIK